MYLGDKKNSGSPPLFPSQVNCFANIELKLYSRSDSNRQDIYSFGKGVYPTVLTWNYQSNSSIIFHFHFFCYFSIHY